MASAPDFYHPVQYWTYLIVLVVTLGTELFAMVHCITRKPAAFAAVGNIPKIGWLAMVGGGFLFSLLAFAGSGTTVLGGGGSGGFILTIVAMAAFIATLVYLLDIRPALKDATNGRGGW
jgi:hypothetical protein